MAARLSASTPRRSRKLIRPSPAQVDLAQQHAMNAVTVTMLAMRLHEHRRRMPQRTWAIIKLLRGIVGAVPELQQLIGRQSILAQSWPTPASTIWWVPGLIPHPDWSNSLQLSVS